MCVSQLMETGGCRRVEYDIGILGDLFICENVPYRFLVLLCRCILSEVLRPEPWARFRRDITLVKNTWQSILRYGRLLITGTRPIISSGSSQVLPYPTAETLEGVELVVIAAAAVGSSSFAVSDSTKRNNRISPINQNFWNRSCHTWCHKHFGMVWLTLCLHISMIILRSPLQEQLGNLSMKYHRTQGM